MWLDAVVHGQIGLPIASGDGAQAVLLVADVACLAVAVMVAVAVAEIQRQDVRVFIGPVAVRNQLYG
jgi:uncharacterized membrane protein YoaK (UPF0700 family)